MEASAVTLGFMVLQICSSSNNSDERDGMSVWIDPTQVSIVYHSRETPDGCTRVVMVNGRSVYVHGSEEDITAARNRALTERANLEREK